MSENFVPLKYYDLDSMEEIVYNDSSLCNTRQSSRVYINGVLTHECIGKCSDILYLMPFKDHYALHREDGPAIITELGNTAYFYYHGVNMGIYDMPIDDEIKFYLTFKYGKHGNCHPDPFIWYDVEDMHHE